MKYAVVIGRRYGTRVVTADLGKRGPHPWAEVTCDCGFVSRSAVFELATKGLGCPRMCTPGKLAPARDEEREARDRGERQEAHKRARAETANRRAERRARYAKMHETMTLKEIGAIEGVHLSYVSLVLLGKR